MPTTKRVIALAASTLFLLAGCGGTSRDDTPATDPVNILPNSDFSSSNDDVWVFYDNATGASSSSEVKDCTADGFSGSCLTFTAASYYTSQTYDSAVVLDDGAVAGTANQVLTLDTGKTYRVSFRAKASQAAKVRLLMQTPSYVPVKDQLFDVGTTTATYQTATFQSTQTQATFALQLGYTANAGATIQVDDIQLLEQ